MKTRQSLSRKHYPVLETMATNEVEAFIARGDELHTLHDCAGALACYDGAVALDPTDAEAWTSRGNVLEELCKPALAAESYLRAIHAESEEDSDLWHLRGKALFAAGQYDEAARSYAKELAVMTSRPEQATVAALADVHVSRGNALHHTLPRLQGVEGALAEYELALSMVPTHAAASANRAKNIARLFWPRCSTHSGQQPLVPYRTWTLPKRNVLAVSDPNTLHSVHCCRWLDAPTCAAYIEAAEYHAAQCGGWNGSRHQDYATTDFEVSACCATAPPHRLLCVRAVVRVCFSSSTSPCR